MKNIELTQENVQLKARLHVLETQLAEQASVAEKQGELLVEKVKTITKHESTIIKHESTITKQESTITKQESTISNKAHRISTLEEYIKAMRLQRFGQSSEKLTDLQLGLFDEAELLSDELDDDNVDDITLVPAHKRKKKRISIPDDLPSVDVVHDVSDDEKVCPHDGTPLRHFADECSKQLDYQPAKLTVINHIRRKYLCPCCEKHMVTAKKPKQPIEKSIASPNLLAQVAVQKYLDALPLYRQSNIFERLGVKLDPTTLANWMIRCGLLVQPFINLMQEIQYEQHIVFMDETVLQVLKEEGRTAKQQSRLWVTLTQGTQPISLFHYSATRSRDVALSILGDYQGALMTDGYGVYDHVCQKNNLPHLGCWAHARRYFVEAKAVQAKGKTGKSDKALAYIQRLFNLERSLSKLLPEERYVRRQNEAIPILNQLKDWCDKTRQHPVKSEKLKKALTYLSNQWPKLIRYTEDGAWPFHNNPAENAIRPLVVGRKNWLFAATVAGAKASANLYSLIETAKANGLEPLEYLRQVFTLLPQAETIDDIEKLLPWNVNKVVG